MKIESSNQTATVNHEVAEVPTTENHIVNSSELQTVAQEISERDKAQKKSEVHLAGQARAIELQSLVNNVDPQPKIPDTAPEPSFKKLRLQNKGPEVEALQKQLNEWRVRHGRAPIKEDGVFKTETEAAVRDFQKANHLERIDGVAGDKTNAALRGDALSNEMNRQLFEADRSALEAPFVQKFAPRTKQGIEGLMNAYSNNPVARGNLVKLVRDPNFGQLSAKDQQKFLAEFEKNPTDESHLKKILQEVKTRAEEQYDPYIPKLDSPSDPGKPIPV